MFDYYTVKSHVRKMLFKLLSFLRNVNVNGLTLRKLQSLQIARIKLESKSF